MSIIPSCKQFNHFNEINLCLSESLKLLEFLQWNHDSCLRYEILNGESFSTYLFASIMVLFYYFFFLLLLHFSFSDSWTFIHGALKVDFWNCPNQAICKLIFIIWLLLHVRCSDFLFCLETWPFFYTHYYFLL